MTHPQPYGSQPGHEPRSDYSAQPGSSGQQGSDPRSGPGGGTGVGTGAGTGAESRSGFLRALFDLKFERFVTVRFASVIYVISIVLAVLGYVGTVAWSIIVAVAGGVASSYASQFGYDSGGSGLSMLGIFAAILLGWIPYLVQIIFTRVIIEFVVANVRTAQNTQKLVERS